MKSKLFTAIATLTGTVIGAGFLGIPYVVSKSGFIIGMGHMILICFFMMLINLMFAEIVLSSNTIHQLSGYASKYLGRKTKIFVFIASAIGFYSALIAYIMGEGESISFIIFGNSIRFSFIIGIVFWIAMSALTLGGIKSFKRIEPLAVSAVFIVTLIIGVLNFNRIDFANLSYSNPSFLFFPFGVVLFAFIGMSSVPEMRIILKGNEKLMKKSIIIGSLIPLIVYALFTILVIGLNGQNVPEIATLSFGRFSALLGMFTMFTAFLALNLALRYTYTLDFSFSGIKAWIFSSIVPGIAYILIKLFGLANFIKMLGIGGSVSGGLLSIAILLIHEHVSEQKRFRTPEFRIRLPLIIKTFIILLFVAGIIYEFLSW